MWKLRAGVRCLLAMAAIAAGATTDYAQAQTQAQFEQARKRMVEEVVIGGGVKDQRVVRAMLATPRHEFVSFSQRRQAYFDMALPIGASQTISSPFIVSYMTESLDPQPTDKVLEIGTGSGYQAAVLSPLVKEVYTIEIVESLGQSAQRLLARLKYQNVHVKIGDGYLGWPEYAPFDKIIVTCSPEKVPQPLIDQLREGGKMVIPVGERFQQTLYLYRKTGDKLVAEPLRPTLFVPMTGAAEDNRQVKPDPAHPTSVNGTFEQEVGPGGHLPGWYYQRQATCETDKQAPEGTHYVLFKNSEPGNSCHALQGFGVDGRKVEQMEVSAWVKYTNVLPGPEREMLPMVVVTFYDEQRREVGNYWLGPWHGTAAWNRVVQRFRIPSQAREGILRIGLFGATGEIALDDVRMQAVDK